MSGWCGQRRQLWRPRLPYSNWSVVRLSWWLTKGSAERAAMGTWLWQRAAVSPIAHATHTWGTRQRARESRGQNKNTKSREK